MKIINKNIPFLKWAGGKRWLVDKYSNIFPPTYERYIEPFLGAGSVFFFLKPNNALLSDYNSELINTYEAIQNNWHQVFEELKIHSRDHSDDYYYHVRSMKYEDQYEKAARFIYLNRTCFNGIYRVNKSGIFNVPRGTRDSVIFQTDDFERISQELQNCELIACDFEESIQMAETDDLVFADPPYTVRHNNNAFIKYNEKLFSWDDQIRLAKCLEDAAMRGVRILATNAYHESVIELYRDRFTLTTISRTSQISARSEFRGNFEELLIQANI